ncbi:MAG TPA: PepSY-associated TM helix domain-containing protein [Abditibacterium sp.]
MSIESANAVAVKRPKSLKLRVHGWLRWAHIYISMFSLLSVLFFSITGITLNHPEWAFTSAETKRETKGQLPANWKKGSEADWFVIAEHLRSKNGVRGAVSEKELDESEGSITFKAPGYSADCFFDPQTGSYELTTTAQGFTGVMNDFHRGRDAGSVWKWLIDISGVLLVFISVTGLGLLYYLKKVRVAAFLAMGVGAMLVYLAMKLAG